VVEATSCNLGGCCSESRVVNLLTINDLGEVRNEVMRIK
jgi:hypothetical protein